MKTMKKMMLGAAAVAMAWGAFWSVEACAEAESVTIGLLLGATLCVLKLTDKRSARGAGNGGM